MQRRSLPYGLRKNILNLTLSHFSSMQKVIILLSVFFTIVLVPKTTLAASASIAAQPEAITSGPADWDAMEEMAETRFQKRVVKKLRKLDEKKQAQKAQDGSRSYIVALLLSIFLGLLGIDRFYLGYPGWGLVKMFTAGLFGILYVLDIILIALGILRPKGGYYRV